MRNKLRLLWIVLIILLLVLGAIVIGKPTPADASELGITTLTASTLQDGRAETIFCQVGADRTAYWVSMYIYPWEPGKGYPLVLDLEYESTNGNCHTFSAEWHPLNNGLYHADTYVSRGGGNLIYYHDSCRYARLWIPMAFYSGAPSSRPEGEN